MLFHLWSATARYERFLALHVILIVPGTAGDFFVLVEKFAGRETFLEKGSPSPCPSLPKTFAGEPARMESLRRGRAGCVIGQGRGIARPEAVAIRRRESASGVFVLVR